jgi:RimJ/RimL family protein N-acetyltransferase
VSWQPDFPGPQPVRLADDGLVLREWTADDAPRMVELFDDPEIARWTPLASPFDLASAQEYLNRAVSRRRDGGALQLAITEGGPPLGEVLLFRREDGAEVGWALGKAYRGRGLVTRAVRILIRWAAPTWRIPRFRALIEPGNMASEAVAAASGFSLVPGHAVTVETKGRRTDLMIWERLVLDVSGAAAGSG